MLPEDIAACALHHYEARMTRGRPKADGEWTVYAAILAEGENGVLRVLSAATGTKCCTNLVNGCVLHDAHAEVLARRGLVRVLCNECKRKEESSLLDYHPSTGKFKLRGDIKLHLYVSCSPCGDASIYPITNGEILHTGAKLVIKDTDKNTKAPTIDGSNRRILDGTCLARERIQEIGSLRVKSGRSDLPPALRSSSMSCSDKLVLWQVVGMQGAMLSNVVERVTFETIIVSHDARLPPSSNAQLQALSRIPDRIKKVCELSIYGKVINAAIPRVYTVSEAFQFDRAALESCSQRQPGSPATASGGQLEPRGESKKRKRDSRPKLSPCGISVNWQICEHDGIARNSCNRCNNVKSSLEIIAGGRGIKQGRKPKTDSDYEKMASRLSRVRVATLVDDVVGVGEAVSSYKEFKEHLVDPKWRDLKTKILSEGVLSGWLRTQDLGDFTWGTKSMA